MKSIALVMFAIVSVLLLVFFTPATPQKEKEDGAGNGTGKYEDVEVSTFHSFALYGRSPSDDERSLLDGHGYYLKYDRYSMDVYRLVVILAATAIVCGVAYKLLPDGKRNGNRSKAIIETPQNEQISKTFSDGSTYVGEWKNGKMNGQGTFTGKTGSTYVGEWRNNKKHGRGTYRYPDGSKVDGIWRNDKLV